MYALTSNTANHDNHKSINQRTQTHVILLDFSKAFDSVPHHRLLSKLEFYGIRGRPAAWIKAFLNNRTQVVSVNGSHSNPQPVTSGVPKAQSWFQSYFCSILMILRITLTPRYAFSQMIMLYIERSTTSKTT